MNSSSLILQSNSTHGSSFGSIPSFNYEVLGFVIGIIALVIAVVSFAKQERWNKKIQALTNSINDYNQHHMKIENSIKEQSLKRLKTRLNIVDRWFQTLTKELDKKPDLAELTRLINDVGFGKVFQTNSRGFQIYADTLKFLILSSFHNKIESLSRGLFRLSNLENVTPFSNGYELWIEWSKKDRQTITELYEEIEKELNQIKN